MPLTSSARRLGSKTTDSLTAPAAESVSVPSSFSIVSRSRPIIMLIIMSANAGCALRPAWNCFSSSTITSQALFATALAVRGMSVSEAISPKT